MKHQPWALLGIAKRDFFSNTFLENPAKRVFFSSIAVQALSAPSIFAAGFFSVGPFALSHGRAPATPALAVARRGIYATLALAFAFMRRGIDSALALPFAFARRCVEVALAFARRTIAVSRTFAPALALTFACGGVDVALARRTIATGWAFALALARSDQALGP